VFAISAIAQMRCFTANLHKTRPLDHRALEVRWLASLYRASASRDPSGRFGALRKARSTASYTGSSHRQDRTGRGKPDRRTYALTEAGRNELRAWLNEPLQPMQLRHPLLLKLVFAATLEPAKLDSLLDEYQKEMVATRTEYAARLASTDIFDLARSPREAAIWRCRSNTASAGATRKFHGCVERDASCPVRARVAYLANRKRVKSMKLADRVVLVTGASSGIGLEIAGALVREGARVVFAARSMPKLQAAVEAATRTGGRALAVNMDVTDEASVNAAVAEVIRSFGRIDVLVNNAGNGGTLGLWAASHSAAVRAMFDTHVFGRERVTRAVLPAKTGRSTCRKSSSRPGSRSSSCARCVATHHGRCPARTACCC